MKRLSLAKLCIYILSVIFIYGNIFAVLHFEHDHELKISDNKWKIHLLDNFAMKKINGETGFVIEEQRLRHRGELDLFLDFESPLKSLPNYQVIFSDYEQNSFENAFGKYSGKFYFSSHYVSLKPLQTSIFYPGKTPGSFTIEFWVYPYQNFDYQYIVRYIGNNPSDERDINDYGFSIYIKNNRINYQFDNFFWSSQNESYSIHLEEESPITLRKWEHYAISYDIMRGRITTYKNGIEQTVRWITADNGRLSEIYSPLIKDELSTPMLIGRNAFLSIDNLAIIRNIKDNFTQNRYNNADATLVTDIYKLSDNNSRLHKITTKVEMAEFNHYKFAYRISDKYFLPDNTELEWIYFDGNISNFPNKHKSGKYIQFKAVVFPYEENTKRIVIKSIDVQYCEDKTPDSPVFVSAIAGNGKVELSWIPSTETDIIGYEIYYGNGRGYYVCDDSTAGKSPIFVPFEQKGRLKKIDFTLTGLVNEKPYFISIRSVDKNGNRSRYSQEMYARPSIVR